MIAPLKCKNGLCFTAKERTDVLMDLFFSGKHLNEKDFDQNFEQMTNQQFEFIRQLEQKQERVSLWYNEDVKPDYTDPSVYRPLCMSSHTGKVFERILNNRLKTLLMNNNLIDHKQKGFLPDKSTTFTVQTHD